MKDVKTETMRFLPVENGWDAQDKKYNTPRGTVRFAMLDSGWAEAVLDFAGGVYFAEAKDFAVREIFTETDAKTLVIGDETFTREAFEAAERERVTKLHRTREDYADVLGRAVHCVMDRPLGSRHPRHPEMLYPINYGAVPGVMAGDGAEQDVYVLGPTVPLTTFDGVVIAVIHRFDDVEDKWVVAEKPGEFTPEQILAAVEFQEQYYKSELIM